MQNPLIQKLEHGCALSDADKDQIHLAVAQPLTFAARHTIMHEGSTSKYVHVILEGFACNYKQLSNGNRQITAYCLPGDIGDLHVDLLRGIDYSVGTLTACKIAKVHLDTIRRMMAGSPRINHAFCWSALVTSSICREWMASMGRRSAEQKLAHLFCELLVRLRVVALADDNSYDLPLTQQEFGDTLGLSFVHVNRCLKKLRSEGLVTWRANRLTINNLEKLQDLADFNPNYLHLRHFLNQSKTKPA